jgi:hypothetical protein
MSTDKPPGTPISKFIQWTSVEKETARGSRLISIELTPDAQRALTVQVPKDHKAP